MQKTHKLDIRLSADELKEIERGARALNMPKSQYARLLLTGGATQKPQQTQQSQQTPIDEKHIERIEKKIEKLHESFVTLVRAFDDLLAILKEQQRVPSFREYRTRCIVEGVKRIENESEHQFLMRVAMTYYALYKRWPTTADPIRFGPFPQNFDPAEWPSSPPY